MYRNNLVGHRFGRLTVLKYAGYERNHQSVWICRCDCGKEVQARSDYLKVGHTASCGCLKSGNALKHGKSSLRLYNIWRNMKQRCSNVNVHNYHRYGGRDIGICDEWKRDFETFHDWAMENGYADDLSIDRINNDGNYCPENCRWATAKEQANNRSSRKIKEV